MRVNSRQENVIEEIYFNVNYETIFVLTIKIFNFKVILHPFLLLLFPSLLPFQMFPHLIPCPYCKPS